MHVDRTLSPRPVSILCGCQRALQPPTTQPEPGYAAGSHPFTFDYAGVRASRELSVRRVTTAAQMARTPPTASAAGAPNDSAIAPITGPPTGLVPTRTTETRAITRPRRCAGVSNWIIAFIPATVTITVYPTGTDSAAAANAFGARPNTALKHPNA